MAKKETAAPLRVDLYIRVSGREQTIKGLSLEAQQEDLEEYAKERGGVIVGTYMNSHPTRASRWIPATCPANFAKMMEPRKHQIEARIAEENWDIEDAEVGVWAPKHVFIARSKTMTPGDIAPATAANVRMTVYYWAAYRDNTQLRELDKRNMKCVINGVDYMAGVRKALGYS